MSAAVAATELPYGQPERLFSMPAGRVRTKSGVIVFISYSTVIGYQRDGEGPVFTDKWTRSRTTMQHKAKFILAHGGTIVPNSSFEKRCRELGISTAFNDAPHSFA